MGSYRGKRPNRGGSDFGSPKFPKGRKKRSDGEGSQGSQKSPVMVHFFFWIVTISVFMGIFGGFADQIQSIVLWNDIYTLFGAIAYWDMTVGLLITFVVAACIDVVAVS